MLGISEIAILLIVVTLILGAKRLPGVARSLGKSARILKSEARAMKSGGPPPAGDVTAPQGVTTPTRVVPGNAGDKTG